MDYLSKERIAALLMAPQQVAAPEQVDPRIAWYRAGANADEAMGFNSLQRMTGLNLSPRAGVNNLFQGDLSPQNRVQETFRQLPGYY